MTSKNKKIDLGEGRAWCSWNPRYNKGQIYLYTAPARRDYQLLVAFSSEETKWGYIGAYGPSDDNPFFPLRPLLEVATVVNGSLIQRGHLIKGKLEDATTPILDEHSRDFDRLPYYIKERLRLVI